MKFASISMGFYHSSLINSDQYALYKVALIFGLTRWIFYWAHKLVKNYMFLFPFLCFEDEFQSQSQSQSPPPSPSNLAMAIETLTLIKFGEIAEERGENCCDDMSCVVCLMNFKNRDEVWKLRNCSHVFHRQCLDHWLRYDAKLSCPLCRTSLINSSPEEQPSQQQQQPSWAVERILYLFGDDLLYASPYSS